MSERINREPTTEQRKIIEFDDCDKGVFVEADAGTGKTKTMIDFINKDLENNKTHKSIASITFTIKVSKEIKDRLGEQSKDCFIGTNNDFVCSQIIEPFLRDYIYLKYEGLGNVKQKYAEYKISKKYRELNKEDLKFKKNYTEKYESYEQLENLLLKEFKICSYKDIKKNFVFEIANKIIMNSESCKKYLKSKYFKIYIDEYQDCDRDMHKLFMYIFKELKIKIFLVGDIKQSIYTWRGSDKKIFEELKKDEKFERFILSQNFRSADGIVKYGNCIDKNEKYNTKINDGSVICFKYEKEEFLENFKEILEEKYKIDFNKSISILGTQNKHLKEIWEKLKKEELDFMLISASLLLDIGEQSWIYLELACYYTDNEYTKYNFIESELIDRSKIEEIDNVFNKLNRDIKITEEELLQQLTPLFKLFQYKIEKEHIKKLFKTITEDEHKASLNSEKYKHKIMTVHSSKGLEFEQVILFKSDYNIYQNNFDDICKYYVAVTRAKEKLIIVYDA